MSSWDRARGNELIRGKTLEPRGHLLGGREDSAEPQTRAAAGRKEEEKHTAFTSLHLSLGPIFLWDPVLAVVTAALPGHLSLVSVCRGKKSPNILLTAKLEKCPDDTPSC